MKKKVLLFALIMSISAMSFSQVTKEVAIDSVKAKQKDFLEKLTTNDGLNKITIKDKKGSDQFWIEQGKEIIYGKKGGKALSASEKFDKVNGVIKDKKNQITITKFTNNTPTKPVAVPIVKNNKTIGYTVTYNIRNCKTELSCTYLDKEKKTVTNTYDACYDLTATWSVKIKEKKGTAYIKDVELESVKAISNNDEEKLRNLNKEATRLIAEWYTNNIPSYFADKTNGDRILPDGGKVLSDNTPEQKVAGLPDNDNREQTFNVNLPAVLINVDPSKHMITDSVYVENPAAYYTFKPQSFVIKFNENYTKGEIVRVNFEKGKISGPKTEKDKSAALALAKKISQDFFQTIESFKNDPSKEKAEKLKAMFSENGTVDIAYFTPNGIKEQNRDFTKYVKRLELVKNMVIERIGRPDVDFGTTPCTATIEYTQKTEYGEYCDRTDKRINMVQDENGLFKISRIVVVKDPHYCKE